jgi:hypothetical protein
MGNGAMAIGPKLPRPSSTLPQRTLCLPRVPSLASPTDCRVERVSTGEQTTDGQGRGLEAVAAGTSSNFSRMPVSPAPGAATSGQALIVFSRRSPGATSTWSQRLGVFAEFERVMAGLSRAKADGVQLGRRRLKDTDSNKVAAIVAAGAKGTGVGRIAHDFGVGMGAVQRLTDAGAAERPRT